MNRTIRRLLPVLHTSGMLVIPQHHWVRLRKLLREDFDAQLTVRVILDRQMILPESTPHGPIYLVIITTRRRHARLAAAVADMYLRAGWSSCVRIGLRRISRSLQTGLLNLSNHPLPVRRRAHGPRDCMAQA